MSYSTSEHLDHVDSCLVFAKELHDYYPQARLIGKRWHSELVTVGECDVVEIEPSAAPIPDLLPTLNVYVGKRFAGGIVWTGAWDLSPRTMIAHFTPGDGHESKDDALRLALLT